jgi:uncharacterized protein YjbJ (UPF0337 family)
MNWDRVEQNWQQVKSNVKVQWDKLTDDHLDKISGKREHLVAKVQDCYSVKKEEAERQVKNWEESNHDVFAETAAEVKKYVGISRQ